MRRLFGVALLLCLVPSVGGAGIMEVEASAGNSGYMISQADVEESRIAQGLDESCDEQAAVTCIPQEERTCLIYPEVWLTDYCKAIPGENLCENDSL